jgi:hypothetical protein
MKDKNWNNKPPTQATVSTIDYATEIKKIKDREEALLKQATYRQKGARV